MKCKKSLMGYAALLIVFFHFFIMNPNNKLEMNLYYASYIGVDLFFFLSAYSLASRKNVTFSSLILNRLEYVYIPFVILTVIAVIYKHWSIERFFKIISGIEFYNRGGGSFLWFVPGIMILYLFVPSMLAIKRNYGLKTFVFFLLGWWILAWVFTKFINNRAVFILINRLPIFIIGLFYDDFRRLRYQELTDKSLDDETTKGRKNTTAIVLWILLAIILYVVGWVLCYKWGALVKYQKPFYNMFYVIAIPRILGLIMLSDEISQRIKIKNSPLAFIGRSTLELYGLQMIFGNDIALKVFEKVDNRYIHIVITAFILIVMATIFNYCLKFLRSIFSKREVR